MYHNYDNRTKNVTLWIIFLKLVFLQNQKQKLFTEYMHETDQANNLTEIEYLKQIVPKDEEQSINEPSLPSHLISLNALRALPLLEQCRLLLKGCKY